MASAQTTKNLADQELRAMRELRTLLRSDERFVRVHAAESLVEFGESTDAYNAFLEEWKRHRDTPAYRVVVMRVLSNASPNEAEKQQWMNRIRDVFLDASQPDRLHAAECLAKLKYPVPKTEVPAFEQATLSDNPSIAVFANWILAAAGYGPRDGALFAYLRHSEPAGRYCAAYAFRHLQNVPDEVRNELLRSAKTEAVGTLPRAYSLSASYVLAPDAEARSTLRDELAAIAGRGDKDEAREACAAFAAGGEANEVPVLLPLMKHENADIREATARAIICIARRNE
jgi:hypothetical protein